MTGEEGAEVAGLSIPVGINVPVREGVKSTDF
jgi:hypothetical protein